MQTPSKHPDPKRALFTAAQRLRFGVLRAALAGDRLGGDEDVGAAQQRPGVRVQARPVEAASERDRRSHPPILLVLVSTGTGQSSDKNTALGRLRAEPQKLALPGGLGLGCGKGEQSRRGWGGSGPGRWLDVGSRAEDGGGGGFLELRQVRECHPGAQLRQEEPHLFACSLMRRAHIHQAGPATRPRHSRFHSPAPRPSVPLALTTQAFEFRANQLSRVTPQRRECRRLRIADRSCHS